MKLFELIVPLTESNADDARYQQLADNPLLALSGIDPARTQAMKTGPAGGKAYLRAGESVVRDVQLQSEGGDVITLHAHQGGIVAGVTSIASRQIEVCLDAPHDDALGQFIHRTLFPLAGQMLTTGEALRALKQECPDALRASLDALASELPRAAYPGGWVAAWPRSLVPCKNRSDPTGALARSERELGGRLIADVRVVQEGSPTYEGRCLVQPEPGQISDSRDSGVRRDTFHLAFLDALRIRSDMISPVSLSAECATAALIQPGY